MSKLDPRDTPPFRYGERAVCKGISGNPRGVVESCRWEESERYLPATWYVRFRTDAGVLNSVFPSMLIRESEYDFMRSLRGIQSDSSV